MSDARTVSAAAAYVMRLRLRDQVLADISTDIAGAKTCVVCGHLLYRFPDGSTAPQDDARALANCGTPRDAA